MVPDVGVAGPIRDCRVGGPSAPRYFLTVARLMRNSRSIALNDIPLRLAFRIAFLRSFWRKVGLRAEVAAGLLAVATSSIIMLGSLPSSDRECGGSRVSIQRSPKPWSPEVGIGTGAERPWPLRSNTGLGGASWAARMRPSCRTDSRPSSPSTARPGIAGAFQTWQQLQSVQLEPHRVVPGHPPAVFEAQDLPRHSSGSKGRNAGSGYCGGTWKRRLNRGRNCSNTVLASPMLRAPARRSSVISRS